MPARKIALLLGGAREETAGSLPMQPDAQKDVPRLGHKLRKNGFCVYSNPDCISTQTRLLIERAVEHVDTESEVVLLHWVGQMMFLGGRPVLVPTDAQEQDSRGVIFLEEVLERLSKPASISTLFIVTLDCCQDSIRLDTDLAVPGGRDFVIIYVRKTVKNADSGAALQSGFLTQALLHFAFERSSFYDIFKRVKTQVVSKTRGVQEPLLTSASTEPFSRVVHTPFLWSTQQPGGERNQNSPPSETEASESSPSRPLREKLQNGNFQTQLEEAKAQLEWTRSMLEEETERSSALQRKLSEVETMKEAEVQAKLPELGSVRDKLKQGRSRNEELSSLPGNLITLPLLGPCEDRRSSGDMSDALGIPLCRGLASWHDALETGSSSSPMGPSASLGLTSGQTDYFNLETIRTELEEEKARNTELQNKLVELDRFKGTIKEEQRRCAKLQIELARARRVQEKTGSVMSPTELVLPRFSSPASQLLEQTEKMTELQRGLVDMSTLVAAKEANLSREQSNLEEVEQYCSDLRAKLLQDVQSREDLEERLKEAGIARREIANRYTACKQEIVALRVSAMRHDQELLILGKRVAKLTQVIQGEERCTASTDAGNAAVAVPRELCEAEAEATWEESDSCLFTRQESHACVVTSQELDEIWSIQEALQQTISELTPGVDKRLAAKQDNLLRGASRCGATPIWKVSNGVETIKPGCEEQEEHLKSQDLLYKRIADLEHELDTKNCDIKYLEQELDLRMAEPCMKSSFDVLSSLNQM